MQHHDACTLHLDLDKICKLKHSVNKRYISANVVVIFMLNLTFAYIICHISHLSKLHDEISEGARPLRHTVEAEGCLP